MRERRVRYAIIIDAIIFAMIFRCHFIISFISFRFHIRRLFLCALPCPCVMLLTSRNAARLCTYRPTLPMPDVYMSPPHSRHPQRRSPILRRRTDAATILLMPLIFSHARPDALRYARLLLRAVFFVRQDARRRRQPLGVFIFTFEDAAAFAPSPGFRIGVTPHSHATRCL